MSLRRRATWISLTLGLAACSAASSQSPRPPAAGECRADSDCRADDNCNFGPCRAVREEPACEETARPTSPPLCTGTAAECDPQTHRCTLVWAGRIAANPGDPADALDVCLEVAGTPTVISARPMRAGTYDPSRRPRPEHLNWMTDRGCVTYAGAPRSIAECPAGSGRFLPMVSTAPCGQ